MTDYTVALWQNRTDAQPISTLVIIDVSTTKYAAITALKKYGATSMAAIIVMDDREQVSYFDCELHNGKFTYSKREEFPHLSNNPMIDQSTKWRS